MRETVAAISNPIEVATIRKTYADLYEIDVDPYFSAPVTELIQDSRFGFFKFTNCRPGDDAFYQNLMGRRGYASSEKREFQRAGEMVKDGQVLDVGCGIGNFSKYAKNYKGIELNSDAVAQARKLGRNVVLEDLADQPTNAFQVVTYFQVLEHVPDPYEFLAQGVRCVAPGGLLIVTVPNMGGVMGHVMNAELNYPPHHLTWWSEDTLREIMVAVGLQPETVWYEPLQREHLPLLLFALLRPRVQNHFDFSLRSRLTRKAANFLSRFVPKSVTEFPFVPGHTMLIAGRKPVQAS